MSNGARDYQEKRYRSFDQALVNRREQRLLAALLTEYAPEGRLVLDVPCGYGRFDAVFARLGMTVIGADMSRDMVHLAAENGAGNGTGRWLCASIFALPFDDNTFDSVVCIRLFHHRYNPVERQRLLSELARVSRRFVFLSCYLFAPVHTLTRQWRGTRGRLEILSLSQLQDLTLASGLQIQHVRSLLKIVHAQTFVVLRKTSLVS